ncbi:putative disease resistance protein [Gossypium australe]|uniref:Putative disease resistance protein n=1 Tax=Gossypium australe TaxID=47621 RepID=A0A5B6VU28_9ROSI|nr:putative disease resistance protein [Gossypium australe]
MDFALNKIDKQWDNYRSLNQHMNDLKRKVRKLNGMKEDTDTRMSAELRPRKKPKREVQIWLENVERINGEVQNLNERIGESSTFTRGFHVHDVLKRTREVEELIQQGKFEEGLVVDDSQWIGQVLPTTRLSGEGTKACMEEIWKCLMDDEVVKIGVWGMGGVGKTSIMKLINNQLLEEREKFDIVIWITASKEISIAKLQKDIASQIKVTFCGDECETRRAGMLFEALSRKRRSVIILDDLWQEVSLDKVGIPELSTGSKLVLTTRSFDVCRKMSCRAIKMKPLVEEESWKLFSEKVGRGILNIPEVEPIAKKIVERCAGLPLGVITVASCMKDIDDLFEWRNALKELSDRKKSVNGLEEEVFQQLRFSYDHLKDPKLQHCFLSCTLYPEDWEIEERELVRHWIAEGLVEEMDSRQAEFDRGRAIMNRLVNNCLLEVSSETKNKRCLKMHDLVRDMALHITSAKPRFFVKAGMGLWEPPNVQECSEDLDNVLLMWNRELKFLSPPKCPMLTTLLLPGSDIWNIPEGFFSHMDGLKVLNLSRNSIECLPNSVSNLKNLTALLLADCFQLRYVPSLSNLRALKELDLGGTCIQEVPHGMQNLSNLKCLKLCSRNMGEIPNGIFPRPSCLQELDVGQAFISGKEVGELKKLETFEGRFCSIRNLNMYVQGFHGREEPRQYFIIVGERGWHEEIFPSKTIVLRVGSVYPNEIMLSRHIERLIVCDTSFKSVIPIFSRFFLTSLRNFPSLKILEISNVEYTKRLFSPNCVPPNLEELKVSKCNQLEEIIASEERGRVTMEFYLPRLKNMSLTDLPELKSICSVDAVMICESLEWVEVKYCPKLKRMFSPNCVPPNLKMLKVWECNQLEEIIASEERGRVTMEFCLPRLKNMSLTNLPELKSICSVDAVMICESLEWVEVRYCPKLKRMFSPNCVPPNLEELKVWHCNQLEEIIASEERGRVTMEFCLPRLKKMSLTYLPELKSICSVDAVMICESLEWVDVKYCRKLKRMFSPNCVPPNLEKIEVWVCKQLEEIIASEERGRVTMEFCLPRLKKMSLRDLPELKSICSVDAVMICESLEWVEVEYCPKLRRMFSPNCVPPNLEKLEVWECNQLEEIIASEERGRVTMEFCLPRLKKMSLISLPELKSICSVDAVMICESLEWLKVISCPKLKRMFSPNCVPPNLEELEVWHCNQLEEIIASEERGRVTMKFCLPRLKNMSLGDLPELKSICSVDTVMICESLEWVEVEYCPKLKRMFSPNCVPPNLEKLEVSKCNQLEEIITSEERGRVTMEFCLPRLKKMSLRDLPELKSICSVHAVMICESLKRLFVIRCRKLKRMPFKLPQVMMPFKLPQVEPSLRLGITPEVKKLYESIEWADTDFKYYFGIQRKVMELNGMKEDIGEFCFL